MAKDYDVKLNDLKRKLRYLRSIDDGSSLIKNDIVVLEIFIKRLESKFKAPFDYEGSNQYEDIVEDANSLNHCAKLFPILEELKQEPDNNPLFRYSANYTSILLSDREAVDLAYDFYRTQGDIFYSDFLDIYDGFNNHLQFIEPNNNTNGEMIRLCSTRDTYIFVPNYSNITKVSILIHEIQHAIDTLENSEFSFNNMIAEMAAVFMELISSEYIAKKLKLPLDGTMRRAELQRIIINDSLFLLDKLDMFRSLNGEHITGIESFYKTLYKSGYTDEDIEDNLKYSAQSLVSYQLPQLAAIELYKLYKKNKEEALEILLGIIRYGNDNNIFEILKACNINIGENYYRYQDSLINKLQLKRRN